MSLITKSQKWIFLIGMTKSIQKDTERFMLQAGNWQANSYINFFPVSNWLHFISIQENFFLGENFNSSNHYYRLSTQLDSTECVVYVLYFQTFFFSCVWIVISHDFTVQETKNIVHVLFMHRLRVPRYYS